MLDLLGLVLDFVLHINEHLDVLVREYGLWIYLILFLIVFCETGLVVMPFLPGDSLLFAAGALAASGRLDPVLLCVLLIVAAVAGNSVNYWVGRTAGEELTRRFPRLIRRDHLQRTHEYFERFGGKTIIIARFVPIIRTFAPFVAGIGRMSYGRFLSFNVLGGAGWVLLLVGAGYFFGAIPFVRKNFSVAILAIILISALPVAAEYLRNRRRKRAAIPKP